VLTSSHAPQLPESSLAADVARLRQVLDRQDGPVIVAGHSYGGQIMTAIGALLTTGPPAPALAHLDIDSHGLAWLPEDDFVKHFAADIDPGQARVMHAVQQPLAASALQDVMGVPAWRSHPCWYLVASDDQAIPPAAGCSCSPSRAGTDPAVRRGHAVAGIPSRFFDSVEDMTPIRGLIFSTTFDMLSCEAGRGRLGHRRAGLQSLRMRGHVTRRTSRRTRSGRIAR